MIQPWTGGRINSNQAHTAGMSKSVSKDTKGSAGRSREVWRWEGDLQIFTFVELGSVGRSLMFRRMLGLGS